MAFGSRRRRRRAEVLGVTWAPAISGAQGMAGSLNMTMIAQGEALSRRPTPTGLASGSSAFVEAFTVVRARSHTMLTATTPSTVWAGSNRECLPRRALRLLRRTLTRLHGWPAAHGPSVAAHSWTRGLHASLRRRRHKPPLLPESPPAPDSRRVDAAQAFPTPDAAGSRPSRDSPGSEICAAIESGRSARTI